MKWWSRTSSSISVVFKRTGLPADAWALMLVFIVGVTVGYQTVDNGELGTFYQDTYAPAVNLACGRGYVNSVDPAITAFLNSEDGQYNCDSAFSEESVLDLSNLQRNGMYLEWAVAALWKINGVSWGELGLLFGLLYGFSAASVYGILRLLTHPWWAAAGAGLFIFSPMQRIVLPDLRDYSKVPFLLAGFFLIWLLAAKDLNRRTRLLVCALGGAILGFGFGFRTDAILVVPFVLLVLVGLTPLRGASEWKAKALASAAFLSSFVFAALPIIVSYGGGGNTFFWAVEGATTSFTDALDLEQEVYNLGYRYNDAYALDQVNAFSYMDAGNTEFIELASAENEEAAFSLLAEAAQTFPADFAVRIAAAMEQSLNLGPSTVGARLDLSTNALVRAVGGLLYRFPAVPLMFLATAVLACVRPRLGVTAVLFWVTFGGITAAQFHPRHALHLEAVSLAAIFVVGVGAAALARAYRRDQLDPVTVRRGSRRILVSLLLVAIVPVGSIAVLREYQRPQVEQLIDGLQTAPRTQIDVTLEPSAHAGLRRLQVDDSQMPWRGSQATSAAHLIATFEARQCPTPVVQPTFRYEAGDDFHDHTTMTPITVDSLSSPVEVHLTVFTGEATGNFVGIELPEAQLDCLTDVQAVADFRQVPLPINLRLPSNWRDITLHQSFPGLESVREPFPVRLGRLPDGPRVDFDGAVFANRGVIASGSRVSYEGTDVGPQEYLVQMPHLHMHAGQQLLLQGTLDGPGLTVGLVDEAQAWSVQEVVDADGPFRVVLTPPADGSYALVLANNLPAPGRNVVRVEGAVIADG